ncbi:MAG TPA: threonine synthase [Acidobacteriaceae bacterium]|nr:threonine synthase [Acidobacteriaceae bacterium]
MEFEPHQLVCIGCGRTVAPDEPSRDFRCSECGNLFEVNYSWSAPSQESARTGSAVSEGRQPNPSALRWRWRERLDSNLDIDLSGVWRFRDLLPILREPERAVTLREGNTPLYRLNRVAEELGLENLYAKHQGMNPTGSFKDTGMTAALSVARELGFQWVACASTGNTSAAMAAYAARARMNCLVLLPEGKISWPKLSQSIDYGALTCQLKTDFDGCARVLLEVVRRAPVYLLNSVNPYRLEGQKTPALEIAEELEWQVPDHLIVPGGNLANSSALGKGFLEMKHLGLTARVPKISVIQAEGANPLYRSLKDFDGRHIEPVEANTRASAIRIGNPASWKKAVRVIEQTGGFCEQASETEIALAKAEIGQEGIGCEPASAVTLAGLKKLVAAGKVQPGESVVLLLTGHMLKDSDYTIDFHRGQLLTEKETKGWEAEIESRRRGTRSLEADPDAVLRELEATVPA